MDSAPRCGQAIQEFHAPPDSEQPTKAHYQPGWAFFISNQKGNHFMYDIIGPRLSKLGNQFPFLNFTPEQQQQILELLAQMEVIFKQAEQAA